eukprot:6182965-Prymnesium_polylepis.2
MARCSLLWRAVCQKLILARPSLIWQAQRDAAGAAPAETPAAPQAPLLQSAKPKAAAGCFGFCGGAVDEEVAVPSPITVGERDVALMPARTAVPPPAHLDKAQGGNPLLELVDGFAWVPLKVGVRRAPLLEALTASGAFDNQEVCTAIAVEMCALDVGAAAQ